MSSIVNMDVNSVDKEGQFCARDRATPRARAARVGPAGTSPGAMARQDLCPPHPVRPGPVSGHTYRGPLAAKVALFLAAINNMDSVDQLNDRSTT
jgi:hypothetical protein